MSYSNSESESESRFLGKGGGSARAARFRRSLPLYCLILGALPVLPLVFTQSPVLNNDMLLAYFSYFWDFHQNFQWFNPPTFWSSSYQTGMPMHAYWQSGYLYPITWICFGPISPHYGIYLFYAFHFALGIYGFTRLGPQVNLTLPASLWSGICFSLSGTLLARYEHPTFLAGWCFIPLIAYAYLRLWRRPGSRSLFIYASLVALQAFGGHPQASFTTALMIGVLFLGTIWSRPARKTLAFVGGGQILALVYCAPLLVPLFQILGEVQRFDGVTWEVSTGEQLADPENLAASSNETFSFQKFSTGGLRPLHLGSLVLPRLLGTPSNASWWGGEVWGEVFLYIGGLGLLFCFFASPRRMSIPAVSLLAAGLLGLWFAFGANLGASHILHAIPGFNEFRRPARYLVLFVLALALLSGHGWQRWMAKPPKLKPLIWLGGSVLFTALLLTVLRFNPGIIIHSVTSMGSILDLDPQKDYSGKISLLLVGITFDTWFLALSLAGILWVSISGRKKVLLIFLILSLDLLRLHWDHFYRFPSSFYRETPRTEAYFDSGTRSLWRIGHYLEYPGLEYWQMHNGPLEHPQLFEREKLSLSYGIHAVFGYDHHSAHLPFMWKWNEPISLADKSVRYFMSNRFFGPPFQTLGRVDSIFIYEVKDWKPRMQLLRMDSLPAPSPACKENQTSSFELCLDELRDGHWKVSGAFQNGDTLLFRERYHPEWRYRLLGKRWKKPIRTPQDFMMAGLEENTAVLEWRFIPYSLYGSLAVAVAFSLFLFGYLRRIRQ